MPDELISKPQLMYFASVFYAVFNSHECDRDRARRKVLERYGAEEWKRVLKCKRTGVMEIFEHQPFPALEVFAYETAKAADLRVIREKDRKEKRCPKYLIGRAKG